MPRVKKEFREVHRAADKFEAQLEARFARAVKKLQESIAINDLALSIANGHSIDMIMKLFPTTYVKDTLSPLGTTTKAAFIKGGRLGVDQLNDA